MPSYKTAPNLPPPTTFPLNVIYWVSYAIFFVIMVVVLVAIMTFTFWPASPDATGGCTDDSMCYVQGPNKPGADR